MFFAVDGSDNAAITFSNLIDGKISSSENAFHCWIQCENHIINFMAPIFSEALYSGGSPIKYSRKMFQKPLQHMATNHADLFCPGDFYLEPNLTLTQELIKHFLSRNDNKDLVDICLHWYKKPPKVIQRELVMGVSDGEPVKMTLSPIELVGAW